MNALVLIFSWIIAWNLTLVVRAVWMRIVGKKIEGFTFYLIHLCIAICLVFLVFWIYESYLTYKLDSYDINHNGMFDGNEISTDQTLALDAWANDSGRNIFRLASIPVYFLIDMFIFIIAFMKKP